MRVVPDGDACEVVFTLRRQQGMSDAEFERDAISKRTKEALAAAKARGVKLGDYGRISKAKEAATKARAETFRPAFEETAHLSANAAALALNERGIKTASGAIWRAEQVIRTRRVLAER